MKCKWKACFLLMGELAFGCAPAMAMVPIAGNWDLITFTGTARTGKNMGCINLTYTGRINGEPTGTWSGLGSNGSWRQNDINLYVFGPPGTQVAVTNLIDTQRDEIDGKFFVYIRRTPISYGKFRAIRHNGACPRRYR